jgi:L-arabinokinase
LTLPADFTEHLDRLRQLPQHNNATLRTLFELGAQIYVARAPGRLDVMGGIADYSGSLVLELPIAEATFVAVQQAPSGDITIVSSRDNASEFSAIKISVSEWSQLINSDYESVRQYFEAKPESAWAAYITGPILTLLKETNSKLNVGLKVFVDSQVAEGKGVSSSAALEVATMRAVATLLGIELPGEELARLCQLAENHVVGAPCGIMDQMTSALGRENELLALRCQPAIIEGFVSIPDGVAFWGVDSGIRHAVSGSDYTSVRCGAFMGYRMISKAAGLNAVVVMDGSGTVLVNDPKWHGYLANLTPQEFQNEFAAAIPDQLSGAEFLKTFAGTTDQITRVDPNRKYAVLAPMLHPINENDRTQKFRALLQSPIDEAALREMGELMFASHASYTACGLASDGTDLIVDFVRQAGPARGLYGAKITGGGSGGTVAILTRAGADSTITEIARQYARLTGREPYVFRGSSPGSYSTPVQQIVI